MQPNQQTPAQANGFKPKWRIFGPLTRVWVSNPFTHDVVYQVADEHNRPFRYRLPAGKVSELPGGAIATLGVKHIVDELIQNSKEDMVRMWDEVVRARHEKGIILRVKESSPLTSSALGGEVDLSVNNGETDESQNLPAAAPEQAFPGLNQQAVSTPGLDPLPITTRSGLDDLVSASLPAHDVMVPPNSNHANAEG